MKNLKQEMLFEWYAVKAKYVKLIEFYQLWKKWCNSFDRNYAKAFDNHFNE